MANYIGDTSLSEQEINMLQIMAEEKRGQFNIGTAPLGETIFKLVRQTGIQLIYVPIEVEEDRSNTFSGMYASFKQDGEKVFYIGINTYEYLDKQIFTLAHELYHHWEDTEMCVCRNLEEPNGLGEQKANRFAAEFLLPTNKLKDEIILRTAGKSHLKEFDHLDLLRFIARLHCDYRLPYKAIVRRLQEIKAITEAQFTELIQEPSRDEQSAYFKIGKNIDPHVFKKLNTRTMEDGAEGDIPYEFIYCFKREIVSRTELADDLSLFGKELVDYDLEEEVSDQDLAELEGLFGGGMEDETK
ncbi:ImmA/IrrE family metallo-endopeptidase [Aneurinibacillus aneurinilyticus]|uniref:Putative toxin-antitoxin system, toxin component n=1 Tax=Aneurinibacillus aneurinilyticus ATCC 12856 TaxID=649747 RepID=U1X748_ANEAE|nr:ImmA/IrrE family metallo-endopeptidase [Aneurinibacillus aneurinilyticus]ERI10363.1 putative toxin-antitoxin system, toxin component [Aneurinibacillus aneurinilyticus ATCC 12856]MED0709598.1 ImmA/IrrE family metallo-endopeptidase [Aneurinibacillus aneurinilyticus]MED0726635.1 ImmA/IrrE family metallo-endopeptidase [Aneurinibacillus aneurinilyticus]MED0730301.1 ImmA/IrrE family metallo-endopeptidase [Aneurinibacillus aneurinilyticus]MED0744284.1 ImmA/IrrE family metallo-endopeptidase [Aneuri